MSENFPFSFETINKFSNLDKIYFTFTKYNKIDLSIGIKVKILQLRVRMQ